jgi:hypothetical protein
MPIVHNDNTTPFHPRPLTTNEQAGNSGMTHVCTIDANDLTTAATNTAQTFTLCALKAGDIIIKTAWRLKTAFQNTADAAFNTDTLSIGDTATGVAAHIAAIEVNLNGTEVFQGFNNTAVHYAAADSLTATFNSMAAKSLKDLNAGEVEIFFQLYRPSVLETSVASTSITK